MVLFVAIIVGCAYGTIMESQFDARVARYYVYDAPWFTVWLFMLCVNLAAAALSRWPWQKRHTGFIVVHAGIIILVVGSWIGQKFGIEGSMTLRVGDAPRGWMLVQEMALTFTDPESGQTYRVPMPLDLKPPREWSGNWWDTFRARLLRIRPDGAVERTTPSGSIKFVFDRFSTSLFEEPVAIPSPDSLTPGVNLRLSSSMMGHSIEPALFAEPSENSVFPMMGLAEIRYVTEFVANPPLPHAGSFRAQALLEVRLEPDGALAWRSTSKAGVSRTGNLKPGDSAAVGWADWVLTHVSSFANAGKSRRIVERPGGSMDPSTVPMPGARGWLETATGYRTETQWFLAGDTYNLTPGGIPVRFAFGYRTEPLPFTVQLERFSVPRDEGTQNPANFRSDLVFRPLDGGPEVRDWCSMNQPALFPGGLMRHITGFAHKFSQASWNPEDLDESTIQVLRDPGWIPKWVGSLVITAGIYIIFYTKPYRFRRPEDAIDERKEKQK
jgi:hypothetical protein